MDVHSAMLHLHLSNWAFNNNYPKPEYFRIEKFLIITDFFQSKLNDPANSSQVAALVVIHDRAITDNLHPGYSQKTIFTISKKIWYPSELSGFFSHVT